MSVVAIVADFSGLTRDRKYGRLKDSQLTLIDTGGLNQDTDDMSQAIKEQTDLAIEEADYLLSVSYTHLTLPTTPYV